MNQQQRAVVQQTLEMANATLHEALEHIAKLKEENAALRQLLEQPEHEPVAVVTATNHLDGRVKWLTPFSQGLPLGTEFYTTPPAQPADHGDELTIAYLDGVHTGKQIAKREWVGLTDEELRRIEAEFRAERVRTSDEEYLVIYPGDYWQWQRAIEQTLREKNGGA
jgi:hypothetical protein